MRTKINAALAQIAPRMGDVKGNFSKVIENVRRAKREGVDVVVFPELATAGYLSQGTFLEAPEQGGPYFRRLLGETRNLHVILGFVEETELGILHNSAVVLGGGRVIEGKAGHLKPKSYKKCYPPTYGMFEELRWFAPGSNVPVFDLNIAGVGRVGTGVIICEDFWQPLPARIAAMRGAEFITAIAASPKTLSKPQVVDALLKTRAIENSTYVIFVNAAGSQDMVNFWGGSCIISPEGDVLVRAKMREEDFVVGEIDLYKMRKIRQLNPMLRDERRELIEDYYQAFKEMKGIAV